MGMRTLLLILSILSPALPGATATGPIAGEEPNGTAATRGPVPPQGYVDACVELIRQGRFAEARDRLTPIVADHPGWGRIHFYLGLAFHKEARYGEARGLFERAMELEPEYRPAVYYHGWCLYYLGELEAARTQFEAFLESRPDYADAIFALGLIDFDGDAIDAARRRFERAIQLAAAAKDAATEAKARARLADVMIRLGELKAAKIELERSLALAPHNHESWFKLSRVLQRLGEPERAEEARRKHREMLEKARGER